MRYNRREKTGGQQSPVSLSAPKAAEPSTMPFAQRLSCTIDDACEVTGLGRTKLYELIGAGHIVTTTIGRRLLVVVRSLLALHPQCHSVTIDQILVRGINKIFEARLERLTAPKWHFSSSEAGLCAQWLIGRLGSRDERVTAPVTDQKMDGCNISL